MFLTGLNRLRWKTVVRWLFLTDVFVVVFLWWCLCGGVSVVILPRFRRTCWSSESGGPRVGRRLLAFSSCRRRSGWRRRRGDRWRAVPAAVTVNRQPLASWGHDVLEPGQSNESSQMFKCLMMQTGSGSWRWFPWWSIIFVTGGQAVDDDFRDVLSFVLHNRGLYSGYWLLYLWLHDFNNVLDAWQGAGWHWTTSSAECGWCRQRHIPSMPLPFPCAGSSAHPMLNHSSACATNQNGLAIQGLLARAAAWHWTTTPPPCHSQSAHHPHRPEAMHGGASMGTSLRHRGSRNI